MFDFFTTSLFSIFTDNGVFSLNSLTRLTTNLSSLLPAEIEYTKMNLFLEKIINWSLTIGGRIAAAVLIFFIGRFAIKLINRLFERILTRNSVDPGIKSFLKSLINALLLLLLIIAVVNKLGIETTSMAALLASFGVAIGMAMSGNLSNLVGGIIILMFRPYKVGDWVEVNGVLGQVQAIEIFHTILRTYSGANIYFANGSMSTSMIKNYSKEENLRIEFKLGLEYGQDLTKVDQLLLKLAHEDKRVLTDPAPSIALDKFSDSSVDVVFRVWVSKADYWNTKYDLNRQIYDQFNAAGISFPFPQITVHQKK